MGSLPCPPELLPGTEREGLTPKAQCPHPGPQPCRNRKNVAHRLRFSLSGPSLTLRVKGTAPIWRPHFQWAEGSGGKGARSQRGRQTQQTRPCHGPWAMSRGESRGFPALPHHPRCSRRQVPVSISAKRASSLYGYFQPKKKNQT